MLILRRTFQIDEPYEVNNKNVLLQKFLRQFMSIPLIHTECFNNDTVLLSITYQL